jgi:hypothetical protein
MVTAVEAGLAVQAVVQKGQAEVMRRLEHHHHPVREEIRLVLPI